MFWSFHLRKRHGVIAALCMVSLLAGVALYAGDAIRQTAAESEQAVELPIIMYHGLLQDPKRSGAYVITPDVFEKDLQYLQEKGYTTVVMQDLLDYVYENKPLPEKPVMLTFDDGYYNNYLYAFPLLKKYQSKIVLSPIGRYTDQYSEKDGGHANYSHVTWDEIKEMMASGLVEIQNHSYNMHASSKTPRKGALRAAGETVEQYKEALTDDVMKMQNRVLDMTGYLPTTFTYPFGAVSKEAQPILQGLGFKATLICESHVNRITRDPACLYGLGRYLRPSGVSSERYFTKTVGLPKASNA